jgi:hypothetical protein
MVRCSRQWGPLGAEECPNPARYRIVRGIWVGYYVCEQCRKELDYPVEYLEELGYVEPFRARLSRARAGQ